MSAPASSAPPAPGLLALSRLLACAAVEPGLDGLLLLDAPAAAVPAMADALATLLAHRTGGECRALTLGAHTTDDDLWLALRVTGRDGETRLVPGPGPLVQDDDRRPLLVRVPDLARLSLPAMRAALTVLGTSAAVVERHGVSAHWSPDTYWVVGCASGDIGSVSPHVLERLPLRLPVGALLPPPAHELVRRALAGLDAPPPALPGPRAEWVAALRGDVPVPEVSDEAVSRALRIHPAMTGVRRPMALLRLARGLVRLAAGPVVQASHVDEAAVLCRLVDPTLDRGAPDRPSLDPASSSRRDADRPPETSDSPPTPSDVAGAVAGGTVDVAEVRLEPWHDAGEARTLPAATARGALALFPEDAATPVREAASLRMPWQRRTELASTRGVVIGDASATSAVDLDWVATVREAAKYQRLRRSRAAISDVGATSDVGAADVGGADGAAPAVLVIRGSDLRRHRRTPEPEHLLVLVLDQSCRAGWAWEQALAPYLRWAYHARAAVNVVQAGGVDARDPLRAELLRTRSMLDPRVGAAFARAPGSATPLAHALDVARTAIRHTLQHGDAGTSQALLVVATDGRGNVPLRASQGKRAVEQWGTDGVSDSLVVAGELAGLRGVDSVVVHRSPTAYPLLPAGLAQALGARLEAADAVAT